MFRPQILSSRVLVDLKKRSTIGIVFYMIAISVVIFSGNYYQRHPDFSNLFMGCMFGICIFRIAHMLLDRHLPKSRFNNGTFMTSVILTALFWGLGYAQFTTQQEELYNRLLMCICTVGLCAGGVVAFIPNLWLALGFNTCILLPGTTFLLVSPEDQPQGVLFSLFFVYMIFMAARQNKEYWSALDNEYLLERKTKALKRLSNRDELTGLSNRRHFNQTFSYEWDRASRKQTTLNILICDVDHFKKVNDRHGHPAGDAYLQMTAALLQKVYKRKTDVVARYGGEEFIVLMTDESPEAALALAEEFRQRIASAHIDFENRRIRATMSIGHACTTPQARQTGQTLIALADHALYRAKASGRNRVCTEMPELETAYNE
ncbi:MAG: GGDEF domain-containing protein [Desulfobacter sp.]|nr:MAG: GGDEF domain-containing protein [Desulfobacter sp.]